MRDHSVLVWLTAIALLMIPLLPVPTFSATIAHWKLLEGSPGTVATGTGTILDSSGNNLHGTSIGGPIYRANEMEFDDLDDRIHVPKGKSDDQSPIGVVLILLATGVLLALRNIPRKR